MRNSENIPGGGVILLMKKELTMVNMTDEESKVKVLKLGVRQKTGEYIWVE